MKNVKFESLVEELSSEPRSSDYNSVFSSITDIDSKNPLISQIDSKVYQMSRKYGLSPEKIYRAIDVDQEQFLYECAQDPGAVDFHYSDVMSNLQALEKQLVPKGAAMYGGMMHNPIDDECAQLLPGKKPTTTEGEPVKRKEIILKEEMDFFDYIIQEIGKHKTAVVVGILGALGLYAVGNSLVKANKEQYTDDTDAGIANAEAQIFGASGVAAGSLLSNDTSVVNASAKEYQFS